MKGLGHRQNSFCNTMAGTDDQVIAPEIEMLNSRREKRKVIPIIFRNPGESLDKGGLDLHSLDPLGQPVFDIEKCIEVCLRVEITEDLQDPLSSTHPSEPVMNESDFQSFSPFRQLSNSPLSKPLT